MKTFWKKKLPACLLALALLAGTVPMASAASADLTYDVDEDSGVWLDADDFQEIYEDDNGGYLEYVEFTDYDDFDDYGYFTFEDFDRYGFDAVGHVVFRLLHQAENIADQIQLRLTGLAPGHVQIQSPGLQLLVLPGHLGVFRLPLLGGHLGISSHYSASFLLKNLYKSNSVYRFFNKLATPFLLGANTKRAPPKWAGTLFRFPQQPPQPMQLSAQVMVGSQVEMVVP